MRGGSFFFSVVLFVVFVLLLVRLRSFFFLVVVVLDVAGVPFSGPEQAQRHRQGRRRLPILPQVGEQGGEDDGETERER